MVTVTSAVKRVVVGRALRSDRLAHTLLPKRIALPVFASDALSSVAYAPQGIFAVLSVAGLGAYAYAPWLAVLVCAVMVVVVASYRQNVHAYPGGGGDYEVATVNLGPTFGLLVASALLVDYILTVAVSTAAGVANIGSAIGLVGDHPVWFCIAVIVLISALNLRGVRESGSAFAVPVYAFIASIFAMIAVGFTEYFLGVEVRAQSAGIGLQAGPAVTGLALVFLLAKAFSLRVGRVDRGGGDLQRGARVPETQVPQRRDHTCADGRVVGEHDVGSGGVDPVDRCALRAGPGPAGRGARRVRAEDADYADRAGRVHRLPGGVLRRVVRYRVDPGAGLQYGLQRFPGVGVDPGAGPVPAPAVPHPR